MHGHSVEQTHQSEKSVYRAILAARDREPAVLRAQSLERIYEHMHPARVHERDLGQVDDNRIALARENRPHGLP